MTSMNDWPSDDELERNRSELIESLKSGAFLFLDGVMSIQTEKLARAFGVDGVDMTSLWAFTPQDWSCPACGRHKTEIVRPNKNNYLMCRLVEHHDHMQELLKRKFEEISISLDNVVADQVSEAFAKRSSAMISSFDNTVVCDDCNVADTNAKKASGANAHFSYSPNDLKEIVIARPNRPHEIDHQRAILHWKQSEQTFNLRLKIADRIAQIAATNSHWFQTMNFALCPAFIVRRARQIIDQKRAYGVDELLVGSKQPRKPDDPSGWRRRQYIAPKTPPSAGQIQHVAKVKAQKQWRSVAEDWRCDGCRRNKEEIVRITKRNEWSFSLAPRLYRNSTKPNNIGHHTLCSDCGFVAERLGEESRARASLPDGPLSLLVSVEEVAAIIFPRPNTRHNINNAEAEVIVEEIVSRLKSGEECGWAIQSEW